MAKKTILAFAGSTSKKSINKQLVTYVSSKLADTSFDIADLNNFSAPVFSVDEEEMGFPKNIQRFNELLGQYDGFIISLAEHNGSYTAAFKNIYDWVSRIESNVFRNKPLLLMATSPGGRGGASVLETAKTRFSRAGARIITTFSLPNFYDNFKDGSISNKELNRKLVEAVAIFEKTI